MLWFLSAHAAYAALYSFYLDHTGIITHASNAINQDPIGAKKGLISGDEKFAHEADNITAGEVGPGIFVI